MRARKITAINAHEKMSPVYGHGWQTECSYLRRKARFKFSAILAQPQTNRTESSIRHHTLASCQGMASTCLTDFILTPSP